MQILKNYNFFLDSSQRDEGDLPNYFSIVLRRPIIKTNKKSMFRVRIPSVVIPFSFSQVNSTNNKLTYIINNDTYQYTIPNGNYNINDLLTEIKKDIENSNPVKLDFNYNISTSKCILAFNNTMTIPTTLTIPLIPSNKILLLMMGFTSSIELSVININNALIFTNASSNQVVNVSPSKTLFIRSETLTQNTNFESLVDKNENTDILLQIPIYTGFNTFINYHDQSSDLFADIINTTIDKINLYITDSTSYDVLPPDSGLLNWFIQINIQEIYTPHEIDTRYIEDNTIKETDTQPIKDTKEEEKQRSNIINDLTNEKNKLIEELNKTKSLLNKDLLI